ncbi:MAG: CPBP family glutamic-type intramembrane protease [Luteolibacter sp.]
MRFLKSEAGAIILWLIASLVAAAFLMPHLYDEGKELAQSTATDDYPGVVEWIGASAGRAKPDRFFSRALLVSALVLIPALTYRVKQIRKSSNAPDKYTLHKLPWQGRLVHLVSGLLLGSLSLGLLALVLELSGASIAKEIPPIGKFFTKAFLPALGAGVIEELVFRGLLLGLWLRACSLWTAWIGSALMFSFVHFLSPPDGMVILDPRAWYAGFEILGSTLGHFSNPLFFVTDFATLALLGLLLAWCRTRTHSLWMPIGIHAGLVFALKTFSMTRDLNPLSPLHPWFIGNDLKSGILPLLALAICFAATVFTTRKLSNPGSSNLSSL